MEIIILPKSAPERALKLGTFDVWTEKPSKSLLKYNISENFRGEERNFPGWGTGMKPEPPKAARATFLARILGNFVPHRENFRKYYSHDSNSFQLDNYHLKAITVHFKSVNCLKIVELCLIFSWNTHTSKKWECQMRAWSIDQWS